MTRDQNQNQRPEGELPNMLPLLLVLALCTYVVSSDPCLTDSDGAIVPSGSDLTCDCGTTGTTASCSTNVPMGCDAAANTCLCLPGSAWGTAPGLMTGECIVCGPFTADERDQEWYTQGYKCAGGSTMVVGDGKTICPAGTVDYRECDLSSQTCKKGSTSCKPCGTGQYQDQEGTAIQIDNMPAFAIWYVFLFSLYFLFLPSLFKYPSLAHSHNLILFISSIIDLTLLQQNMPWGTLHDSHWTDEFGRLQAMSGRMGK